MRQSKGSMRREAVAYQWIKRPDGSVFRQLNPDCMRAIRQRIFKGKGLYYVRIG